MDYADMTVEELQIEASEREIEGRSSMNKEELIQALSGVDQAEAEATAFDPPPPAGYDPDNPGGQSMEVPGPPAPGEE